MCACSLQSGGGGEEEDEEKKKGVCVNFTFLIQRGIHLVFIDWLAHADLARHRLDQCKSKLYSVLMRTFRSPEKKNILRAAAGGILSSLPTPATRELAGRIKPLYCHHEKHVTPDELRE